MINLLVLISHTFTHIMGELIEELVEVYDIYVPEKVFHLKIIIVLFITLSDLRGLIEVYTNSSYLGIVKYFFLFFCFFMVTHFLKRKWADIPLNKRWALTQTFYKPYCSFLLFFLYYGYYGSQDILIFFIGALLFFYTIYKTINTCSLVEVQSIIYYNLPQIFYNLIEGFSLFLFLQYPLLCPLYIITTELCDLFSVSLRKDTCKNVVEIDPASIFYIKSLDFLIYAVLYLSSVYLGEIRILSVNTIYCAFFAEIIYYWVFKALIS